MPEEGFHQLPLLLCALGLLGTGFSYKHHLRSKEGKACDSSPPSLGHSRWSLSANRPEIYTETGHTALDSSRFTESALYILPGFSRLTCDQRL